MSLAHRLCIRRVDEVGPGPDHVLGLRTRLTQRSKSDLEATPRLSLRVRIDRPVGPDRGGPGDDDPIPEPDRATEADGILEWAS
jgi:hypothetical protein